MAFALYYGDRRYREYSIVVKNRTGQVVELTGGVKAALLPVGSTPDENTEWVEASYAEGVVLVLLLGPGAAVTGGALVIPLGGADLWFQYEDETELEADFVESVSVR